MSSKPSPVGFTANATQERGAPVRRHPEVIAELIPLDGTRVVDVGCGDGALTRLLTKRGAKAVGLEISQAKLKRALAAPAVGDERYLEGSGERLPFADSSADTIIYLNSFHHVPVTAQAAALAEAARVLVPGGRLLILEPLAQGAFFDLVRAIEDETEIRAQAHAAIQAAAQHGLRMLQEVWYDCPVKFADFAAFERSVVAVDEARVAAFARLKGELEQGFAAKGDARADGTYFAQPFRASLLEKASS